MIACPISIWAQSAYEVYVDSLLIVASLKIAHAQVGETEESFNRSPKIDSYNLSIGNPLGSPYCQAGQYWTFRFALSLVKKGNNPIPRNGLAVSTFYFAKQKGKKIKYQYYPHSFLVWKTKNKLNGHIERIIEYKKKGWVVTIGFNVSSPSNPKVEGVFYKTRNIFMPLNRIKMILGIVRMKAK